MDMSVTPLFDMPAALLAQGYRLRPEIESDIPFLMQVYAATRETELACVAWSDEQKQAFIASQFNAQRHYYRTAMANCSFKVIEHHGAAAGRLYLQPRATQLYIVDIALLPAYCGHGLGSAMLRALQDSAGERGLGVGIMAEKFNPALRLYRRLGFVEIADHDVYLEMEWTAAVSPSLARAVS
jgi:ribosomal protein S18 acetylase RimI-like enzyme